ncbi:hypothetical protein JMN32_06770 [Fulvivirga sp. 29W222]|uniref:Uncharacterized protein n=1 Tax=Fulvivirga marina TaxID=2494733 RepID=A0A937FUB2_9BACT|nr:hypothetical protein [Fulvivirga marina]MBL6446004.1 hypothetical protein [Fulvivirga marina]
MSEHEKTLQIPVYLDVERIVAAYQKTSPGQIIPLDDEYYKIPIAKEGVIDVSGCESIQFTLSNNEGTDGTMFWLTSFKSKSSSIVQPGPNPMGTNMPANVMVLTVKPDPGTKTETQTFTLHCYFVHYADSEYKNVVYHCTIDPKLKSDQTVNPPN